MSHLNYREIIIRHWQPILGRVAAVRPQAGVTVPAFRAAGRFRCVPNYCGHVAARQTRRRYQALCTLALLCVLLFDVTANRALAIEPVMLDPAKTRYAIGPNLEYLEDPHQALKLDDVSKGGHRTQFARSAKEALNFGYSDSVYWVHFRLVNHDSPAVWLLENQYALLDYVELYLMFADGRVGMQSSGDMRPFAQRAVNHRNLLFNVPLRASEQVDVYLRVQGRGSLQIPLVLWEPSTFITKSQHEQLILGMYYGILLGMLLYNLMIYFSLRDINYLYYVLHIAGFGLLLGTLNGLAFEYLWPNAPQWGNQALFFFLGAAFFFMVQFSRSFLGVKVHLPRFDLVLKGFLAIFALVSLASLEFQAYVPVREIGSRSAFLVTVVIFIVGLICLGKGVQQARYFMLAWSIFLVGVAAYTLRAFGVLPNVFITEYGIQIGSALEVVLLSFALADRMRILKEENERIQRDATETLERRVTQRTTELNAVLSDLSEAHEALKNLSTIDGLTGVKNRKFFDEAHDREWKRAYRDGYALAVLLIDIDEFKRINDGSGHLAGDEALKHIADVIGRNLLRPGDLVARYGGDEFAVIAPRMDMEGATALAEQMRGQVAAASVDYEGERIAVTVSIGVAALVPSTSHSAELLISAADGALYDAKNQGRDRVCVSNLAVMHAARR